MRTKKHRTEVVRTDPKFREMIKSIQAKKFTQEKRMVKSSRITLAMFNQYSKYPELMRELEKADLK